MGLNIAGLILKDTTSNQLDELFGSKLTYVACVNFEEALSSYRDENTVDVLISSKGAFVIMAFDQIIDLSNFDGEIIQFMISDLSDTYYFEKYRDGQLIRKYIYSQGEIAEDHGTGIIDIDDGDITDGIWKIVDETLQNDFSNTMFEQAFKRCAFARISE